jgi:hypothetical protein
MQRQFTISTPAQTVTLDANGRADVLFTVANVSGVPTRGMARTVALGATQSDWLTLAGDAEREFPTGAMHQFAVVVQVPPTAAGGRYTFRIDVISARKSGEELAESPIVSIDVPARAAATKRSTSWLAYAALALVLVVGAAAYLMMREPEPDPPGPGPIVTHTAGPLPSPTGKIAPPVDDRVAVPNVISAAVAKAEWELEAAGLKSSRKEVIDRAATPGTVRMSSPKPGEKVAKGSVVELEVVIAEDLVSVPDVVGTMWEGAKANIEKVGLIAVSKNQLTFRAEDYGKVIEQSLAGGTDVKRGTKITLVVYAANW